MKWNSIGMCRALLDRLVRFVGERFETADRSPHHCKCSRNIRFAFARLLEFFNADFERIVLFDEVIAAGHRPFEEAPAQAVVEEGFLIVRYECKHHHLSCLCLRGLTHFKPLARFLGGSY